MGGHVSAAPMPDILLHFGARAFHATLGPARQPGGRLLPVALRPTALFFPSSGPAAGIMKISKVLLRLLRSRARASTTRQETRAAPSSARYRNFFTAILAR